MKFGPGHRLLGQWALILRSGFLGPPLRPDAREAGSIDAHRPAKLLPAQNSIRTGF